MLFLMDAVDLVEGVDLSSQKLLRRVMCETIYHKKSVVPLAKNEDASQLVEAGLCILIDDPSGVILSPDLGKVQRKLYTYLRRRNEEDPYMDENGVITTIPCGSSFEAVVSIGGSVSFALAFPEDEVTDLLDLHGVNKCRGWHK